MANDSKSDLPELSPAQELALKQKFAKEEGLILDTEGHVLLTAPVETAPVEAAQAQDMVWTNLTNSDLIINDLGQKIGDEFISEVFKPFETKDLSVIYKAREVRQSKSLRRYESDSPPKIARGTISADDPRRRLSQLARMAKENEGKAVTFTDPEHPPLRGVTGEPMGEYDKKLAEVIAKDQREDQESRQPV